VNRGSITPCLGHYACCSFGKLPLRRRGDQGFLNEYFKDFASAAVFDPSLDYSPNAHHYMMLPTRYNADIGLYVFNSNRWLLEGPLKVIHYTLGSFKPWAWWCGWLVEEQARWNVRLAHFQMTFVSCGSRQSFPLRPTCSAASLVVNCSSSSWDGLRRMPELAAHLDISHRALP
jgi:hypothetical protein